MEKKKKQSISMQEETFSARNAKNSDVIRRIYNWTVYVNVITGKFLDFLMMEKFEMTLRSRDTAYEKSAKWEYLLLKIFKI